MIETFAVIYLSLVGLVLVGIHLANELTLADRLWFAKRWFRWFGCALRAHPYPSEVYGGSEAYDDWISGNDPFRPPNQCSHCKKVFW